VNVAEQLFGHPHLVSLPGRQQHLRRVAERVDYGVELRRWTAARTANRLVTTFF
jgi:type II secretory pathway predicted ATPase ExeA